MTNAQYDAAYDKGYKAAILECIKDVSKAKADRGTAEKERDAAIAKAEGTKE